MDVSDGGDVWMKLDELERLWSEKEDGANGARKDGSAVGWNGFVRRNGVRKRRRASWRLLKEEISPRGQVLFENSVFRVEQMQGQLVIAAKHRYVRITERGRKFVEEAREIPLMCYEQFFQQYLSHMQTWSVRDINGTRISGVQQKFLRSIMEERVLPMTGDIVRRC